MVGALCFRVSIQRPLIHLFRVRHFALISVKDAQVIDNVKGGYIIRTRCSLVSIERPPIYFFCLCQLALILINAIPISLLVSRA